MNARKRQPLKLPAGATPINDPKQAIAAVRAAYPELGRFGMGMRHYSDEAFCLECVRTAMELLRRCRQVKTPKISSYFLKHTAEHWGRENGGESYIANGDMIVGAVALGLPVSWSGCSPNVAIGVSRKDAVQLDPEWQEQHRRWRR